LLIENSLTVLDDDSGLLDGKVDFLPALSNWLTQVGSELNSDNFVVILHVLDQMFDKILPLLDGPPAIILEGFIGLADFTLDLLLLQEWYLSDVLLCIWVIVYHSLLGLAFSREGSDLIKFPKCKFANHL
jgi:hypothetical protein